MPENKAYRFYSTDESKHRRVWVHDRRIISTYPRFDSTSGELLLLMLLANGFTHQEMAKVLGVTKGSAANKISNLYAGNEAKAGRLIKKAQKLELLSPMAIIGIAAIFGDKTLERQAEKAAEALNGKLLESKGRRPYGIVPQPISRNVLTVNSTNPDRP